MFKKVFDIFAYVKDEEMKYLKEIRFFVAVLLVNAIGSIVTYSLDNVFFLFFIGMVVLGILGMIFSTNQYREYLEDLYE